MFQSTDHQLLLGFIFRATLIDIKTKFDLAHPILSDRFVFKNKLF